MDLSAHSREDFLSLVIRRPILILFWSIPVVSMSLSLPPLWSELRRRYANYSADSGELA
jgi:hypothetical protein